MPPKDMQGHPFDGPVLILAPHLQYPTRNGADILVDRCGRELSAKGWKVSILSESEVVTYERGAVLSRRQTGNQMRPKWKAALRTVIFRSHYLKEKFVTGGFVREVLHQLKSESYGTVIYSYIATSELQQSLPIPQATTQIVLTHNDEFVWFEDAERTSRHALGKRVARLSHGWLKQQLARTDVKTLFAHVSESDRTGYAPYLRAEKSLIMPIGADIPREPVPAVGPNEAPATVLFVGSLSVGMNQDALVHFADRFEPAMRTKNGLDVVVAGSNPTAEIVSLCREKGWTLHANVSDEQLRDLYTSCHAAILPFAYATGAKLKLIGALAQGVPFLATTHASPPAECLMEPSIASDDPSRWAEALEQIRVSGISIEKRRELHAIAENHSWERSIQQFLDQLNA